jgi:M6 family metalloprotease-like protein
MNLHPVSLRRSRLRLLLVVAMALAAPFAQAAYLRNVPQVVTQPDGSVLHLFATGDEYYNWLHDADGYVVIRDPASGFLVYAAKEQGQLKPTALVAGRADPAAAGLAKGLKPDPRFIPSRRAVFPEGINARVLGAPGVPAFSSINNIVVFIRFADEGDFTAQVSTYETFFNATAAGTSSMRSYFREASYQQLTIASTFYPAPKGTKVASYQDAHPRSYYSPYDPSANPVGYDRNSAVDRAEREHTLLATAIGAVASQVPGTLNVDTNDDGEVDNVVFVVSGRAVQGDWGNLLWPHRWSMSSGYAATARINGKLVESYNLQLAENLYVGVLCHEMAHTLGAPDLYHYASCSSAKDLHPVGMWDLMESDLDPPQHLGAYMKQKFMGWTASIPRITASGTYTLQPLTSAAGSAYSIASPNSATEYFVVEYRRKTGTFEALLPGSGLLVYRIKTDTASSQFGNDCGPPDEVYLFRPGGSTAADGDISNAHLGADVMRTSVGDSGNPALFLSDGKPGGISVTNIGPAGETISFTVNLSSGGGGACTTSISPTSQSFAASGGTGSVVVTVSPVGACAWTVTSNAGWVTVTTGASGTDNGTVSYAVTANTGETRSGTLTIAGKTLTVSQSGSGGTLAFSHWLGAASHTDGSNSSHWRTDVAVLNRSSSSATLEYRLYTPGGVVSQQVVLAGNAQDFHRDIAAWLGYTTGSGPLEVRSNQDVFVMGRTYNQVDATHSYGQNYDGQDPDSSLLSAGQSAWLPFLAQNLGFRCNIGVTNSGAATANVTLALYDGQGTLLWSGNDESSAIASGGFIQYLKPFEKYPGRNDLEHAYAKVTVTSGSGIIVWASLVDEATGDPTTVFMKR